MVAIVITFDSFVGLSFHEGPYQDFTRQNVALEGYDRLRPFVDDTNNQVVDTNIQILHITVWFCSRYKNLNREQIDLVATDDQ